MTADLLLDTHPLLWALGAPDRLSAAARAALEDPARARWVSAATGTRSTACWWPRCGSRGWCW